MLLHKYVKQTLQRAYWRKMPARRVHFASTVASCCDARSSVIDQTAPDLICFRRTFRDETEAIECDRRRVQELRAEQYLEIGPRLAGLKLLKVSTEDMEKILVQLTTELDALRQVDPISGELYETREFVALEQKYFVLLEAMDYFTQKNHLKNIMMKGKEKNSSDASAERGIVGHKKHKHSCFSFMYKKNALKNPELSTFKPFHANSHSFREAV